MNEQYKKEDRFVARICCILANINRDTKKRKRPFKEEEFMSTYEKKKQTPEEQAVILKALTLALGGEIK